MSDKEIIIPMSLNRFFDKIYCINLDRRPDRWAKAKEQFDKFNIEVERFSAVDGNVLENKTKLLNGELGIIKSNLEVIKQAKEKRYKNILIFEDDVQLDDDFNTKFDKWIKQVPKDWKFLYLGGNHVGGLHPINRNVYKMFNSFAIHAFGIDSELFTELIDQLDDENIEQAVDVIYGFLHRYYPSYTFKPPLAWQSEGFSDIQNEHKNYEFLK